jgi:hypothetical protein
VILADGELQASKTMTEAARLYGEAPVAIKLRELQTLAEIAREKNLIIVTSGGDVGSSNVVGLTSALNKEQYKGAVANQ